MAARWLTRPVAEAPDAGVRQTARSDRQTPLAVGSHRAWEADARIGYVGNAFKKSYSKNKNRRRGVCGLARSMPPALLFRCSRGCVPGRNGERGEVWPTERQALFLLSAFVVVVVLVLETSHYGHVAHHERPFLHALTVHHLRLEIFFERSTVRRLRRELGDTRARC